MRCRVRGVVGGRDVQRGHVDLLDPQFKHRRLLLDRDAVPIEQFKHKRGDVLHGDAAIHAEDVSPHLLEGFLALDTVMYVVVKLGAFYLLKKVWEGNERDSGYGEVESMQARTDHCSGILTAFVLYALGASS